MRPKQSKFSLFHFCAVLAAGISVFVTSPVRTNARDTSGAVYVMTNNGTQNAVTVFHRNDDGTLIQGGSFLTHGAGFGSGVDPLGSQGSLTLTSDHRLLLAVNAGSNDISVFESKAPVVVFPADLFYGTRPISITVRDNLVYVLNAGGIRTSPDIESTPNQPAASLPGSARAGGGTGAGPPASFSPDGAFLMVTEKATSTIDTYLVDDNGYASAPISNASHGGTPFGFQFARNNVPVVSEAAGGPGGTSAVSSYQINDDGTMEAVTSSLGDTQKATCWLVVTDDRSYAYAANAGSNSISSFTVSPSGSVGLLNAVAGSTGNGTSPIDMSLSTGSHYLYVLNDGNGMVTGFRVESDGSLTPVGTIGGVPSGAQGIAAR
jgi:6-phosphogluconolactonase (cycloisomerase 2 family)